MPRARRWRKIAAKSAAWFAGALVALVVAALLCVNLPFARRIIAKQVSAALAGVLNGKIVIDHIGGVGLTGVAGVKAHLTEPNGRTVIAASGVSARLRTFTLVKSLLGKSGLDVHLDMVSIEHVDALVDADRAGDLLLLKALATPPAPAHAPEKPSTLRLAIDEARLRSAWVHGVPSPGFTVDADLRDMRLGVTLASGKTTLDLRRLGVETRAMPAEANVRGELTAHAVLPPAPQKLAAKASFDGAVADVGTKMDGSLEADHVDAHLAADAPAGSLTRVIPSLALREPAQLRLDAKGTLPDVHATGSVVTGPASVTLTADAVVGTPLHGHLELAADRVDLAGVLKDAPRSDLNARLRANVTVPGAGTPTGNFDLETKPASIAEQRVPAMTANGRLTGAEGNVTLDVAEPGAKTRVTLDLNLRKMEAAFDASISIPDFGRLERLPGSGAGSASVRARGTAYLTTSTVSGDVRARVANVDSNGVRVARADVGATVAGPFSKPDVEAKIVAVDVVAAGRSFDAAAVTARGNADGISVGAQLDGTHGTPDLNLSTRVAMGRRITLTSMDAKIGPSDDPVRARADTVWFGGGVIQAEGVTIDGAGAALSGAARIAPNAMDVRAVSAGLDVGKLARAFGVAKDVRGKLALDVDLKTRGRTARGKVGLELSDAAYAGIDGLDLRVASSVDGRKFTGLVNAKVEGGHVDLDAQDLMLADSPLSPEAWTHAFGHVRVDSEVDFAQVSRVLPTSMLPFDDMAGKVVLSGELTRGAGDVAPETTWRIHTEGLRASAKTQSERPHDGTKVRAPPSWHIGGVDVDASLAIAKEHGRTTLDARFRDAVGPLAELALTADLPYRDLVETGGVSATALESAPFQVHLAVPERRLSKLPPMFATAGVDGEVELKLEASATAREPVVKLEGAVHRLAARGRQKASPIDVSIAGDYGDGLGKLSLNVDTSAKKSLALDSEVHAKVSDLLDHRGGDWDASVKGKLDTFPFEVLSLFGLRRVRGTVSGDLDAATGTHVAPHARVKLNANGVAMARDRSGGARATLDADANDHAMNAKVRFDQPDGFAEATASAGLTWSGPLSPTFDPSKGAAKADASAKHFRLSALQPVIQGILSDLDGRLDADAHLEASSLHGAPKLDGKVVLDQGTFEVTAAAQEFHDVHADVVLRQDGTLRAENISAHGLTGTVKASGEATLDGLSLKQAKLSAKIPSGDPFPVSVQGQSFAKASGDFELRAVPAPQKQEMDLAVNVNSAKVTLFDKTTKAPQPLDKAEHIRIGYHRTPDEFVIVPLERPARLANTEGPPTTLNVTVNLRDVEVVRGTDLRARLEGQPKIRIAQETSMSGEIRLRSGGYLYVQGKKFEIEQGTITFVGEPDNPNVVVTAGWTAPEGTRVFADFVGPLKSGKVTLRSEPVHSKNEILSLILFGTTDGMGASSNSSGTAGTAVGVAGGVATQGLNKALDDVTGLDITTRIDTSDSSNPRPEVEVRVARDVTVAVSHVIGVPPPGSNPDLNYATVNWRFLRNWSLDTTIGDQGSSLMDLVWTYRY